MILTTTYALKLIRTTRATVIGRTVDGHAILQRDEFARVDHASCSDSEHATADERRLYRLAECL